MRANAELVDEELRAKAAAIEQVHASSAEQAKEAATQIARLGSEVEALLQSQRALAAELEAERDDRAALERRVEAARSETEAALLRAHSSARDATSSALQEVGEKLQQRERSELALLARLKAQHAQQGQLEDAGVSVQAANAQTFEEMRAAVEAVEYNVRVERAARDEAVSGLARELARESESRAEAVEAAAAKTREAQESLEQVLRTEIKARMRGEAQMLVAQKQQAAELVDVQRALQGDLEVAVNAIRGQLRVVVEENAQHSGRTEEALVRAAERQRNVDAAHELALQALAKQLAAQAESSDEALRSLERSLSAELISLDERKAAELELAVDALNDKVGTAASQAAAELDEAREDLLSKLEGALEAVMQERAARLSAEEAAATEREVREAVQAALAATAQAKVDEELEEGRRATERARLEALSACRAAREEAGEAVGRVATEVEQLLSSTEGLHETVALEHRARTAAADQVEVASVLEAVVASVVEHELAGGTRQLGAQSSALYATVDALQGALASTSEAFREGLGELGGRCASAEAATVELGAAMEARECVARLVASLEAAEQREALDALASKQVSGEEVHRLNEAVESLRRDLALTTERQAEALAVECESRATAATEALVSIAEVREEVAAASTAAADVGELLGALDKRQRGAEAAAQAAAAAAAAARAVEQTVERVVLAIDETEAQEQRRASDARLGALELSVAVQDAEARERHPDPRPSSCPHRTSPS